MRLEIDAISIDFIGKFIDLECVGLDSEAPNPMDVGEIGSKKIPAHWNGRVLKVLKSELRI